MRLFRRAVTTAVAAALPVVLVGTPAWGPKYILGSFAFGDCSFGDSMFMGDLTATSFSVVDGELQVDGLLAGSCIAGLDVVATVPLAAYTFPVLSLETSCSEEEATLHVRPGKTTVGALPGDGKDGDAVKITLDLSRSTVVERSWSPDDPRSVRAKLCALDRIADHRDPAALARLLNVLALG